jgi:PAS domain S-box-containing protein
VIELGTSKEAGEYYPLIPQEAFVQTEPKVTMRRLATLLRWLTEPSPSVQGIPSCRKARLLSRLLLVIVSIFAVYHTTSLIFRSDFHITWPLVVGYLALASAYLLSRTQFYQVAAILTVLTFLLIPLLVILSGIHDNPPLVFTFVIPGLLLGSMLLSRRATLALASVTILGILVMPLLAPWTIFFRTIAAPLGVIIMTAALFVAAMLHRDRVEQEREAVLRQRTAQLEALREGGLTLTGQLDREELLQSIVSRAIDLSGGSSGSLSLYQPDREVLELAVAVGPHQPTAGTTLNLGEGLSGKVWETGQPLAVDDYQHWEGRPAAYEGNPWTAVMGVPVRTSEVFLGVLDVMTDAPRSFSSADTDLLSMFATQAAIAIRNADLYDQAQQEIAQRRRIELELRDSEERFRAIVENAPFGYYRAGQDGRWQYVNPQWERMHGYLYEEIIGQSFEITQPDKAKEQARELVRRALSGETITGEFGRTRKDGQVEYHSFNVQPVYHQGEIVAIEGFINDITQRRRTEESLRESEELFRLLFEMAPIGMAITALDGRYLRVNQALCDALGYTADELLSRTAEDVSHPEDVAPNLRLRERALNGEFPFYNMEKRYLTKDGQLVHALLQAALVCDTRGQPSHFIGQIADITNRVQAEKEREKLISDLEDALAKIKTLGGLIPICVSCKKIRDDEGFWNQVEVYIAEHSEAEFTHGICPDCRTELYPGFYASEE